jgi:hypothetical protein
MRRSGPASPNLSLEPTRVGESLLAAQLRRQMPTESSQVVEINVSLSFTQRLKAELAVATGSVAKMLWLAYFPSCGLALLWIREENPGWITWAITALCFLFVPVAFLFSAFRGLQAARKNEPFVFRFSPAGMELKTKTAEMKQSWEGVPRVRTGGGFLLVYPNKKCAYPIPLQALPAEQVQSVLAWAAAGGAERVGT